MFNSREVRLPVVACERASCFSRCLRIVVVSLALTVALCMPWPTTAFAAPFVIDLAQSFLTIAGTIDGENGLQAFSAQSGTSLTDYFSGTLLVNLQVPNQLQIVGTSINGVLQPGPFQPSNLPANYALQAPNVYDNSTGYSSLANAFLYGTSGALALDSSGNFSASGSDFRISFGDIRSEAGSSGLFRAIGQMNLVNVAAGQATLKQVGDQYQVTIPFQATGSMDLGLAANMSISGQLVASRPVAGANAPDFINGGFEVNQIGTNPGAAGWINVAPNIPNNYGAMQFPSFGFKPQATEGIGEGFINVHNGTASLYQTIIPAGALQPHTVYAVTFDVGNRDLTDNGNLPNNDMDPFISVKGFFSLGDVLVDFSKHVGESYQLAQLSLMPDGTWSKDITLLLDTNLLTPAELAKSLNFVLQATSTTTLNRGQVDFDNVRLTIVPEPSTVLLALVGVCGLVCLRLRRVPR